MISNREFLGTEPIADILAVTFTTILFVVQFKKVIREMEEKRG